jgi:hypothetical protein
VDIVAAHLVIEGNQVVLCQGDELIDVVRRGQGVLNVLSIAGVKGEVDARLTELRPEAVLAAALPTAAHA